MEFNYEAVKDIGVFHLTGSLIGENDGMRLMDAFNEHLEDGTLHFILNLEELKHVNSSGLGVFITLLTRTRKKGGELFLVNPSDYIKNLMMITKLNTIFNVFESIEGAAKAFPEKH